MKKRKSNGNNNMLGNMVGMGVGNIVGVGLMGATADVAAGLPAGMGKTMAGTAVGLQGVALVGHNLGYVNKSFGGKKKKGSFL